MVDFTDIDTGETLGRAIDALNSWKDEFAAQGIVPTTVTANYTVPGGGGDTPRLILVDATSGNKTITLPLTSAEGSSTRRVIVWKIDVSTNTVSIVPASGDALGYYGLSGAVLKKQDDRIHFFNPIANVWAPEHDYARPVSTFAASGNLGAKDDLVIADTTAGAVVLTLPVAAAGKPSLPGLREYTIKWKVGANALTVAPQAGEQIDTLGVGVAYAFGAVLDVHRFRSDGAQWWRVA